jgi:hypothetical protein
MSAFTIASALFGASGKTSSILGTIGKHWREAVMAALLTIVIYQNTFEHRVFFWVDTIPYLRTLVDDYEDALEDVAMLNKNLAGAIDKTNAEIEQARIITRKLEEQKNMLEGQLLNHREETRIQVQAILNAPTPQSCQAAIGFLRDMIPNLQYDVVGVTNK